MAKRAKKAVIARPITTRRDFEGATAVVQRLSAETSQDSAAELRLQLLLKELDRYEETEEEDTAADPPVEYGGPRRRGSDDSVDAD
jgi:hypothetical protein